MAGTGWEVEFARFFNYPRLSSSASLSYLRPFSKRKLGANRGTWILAESNAVVRIAGSDHAVPSPVLSVTVDGFIAEEHFVSSLHFSWPQVSCVPQCPIRGSRAVFLSYRDNSGEIQKFAVRFRTSCDAEKFLNSAKECFQKTADILPLGCDVVCENSSPPDFSASNGLHNRFDEESSYEEPVATCAPEIPALTYKVAPPEHALSPLLANNIETVFSGLPPSFTELLSNCLTDTGKEQSTAEQNAKYTSLNAGSVPNQPVNGGTVLQDFIGDEDLRAQIAKYMSDDSFHDMLFKIEKVIDEMGGDLSL